MTGKAPGRYCLVVCYCRECDHYVPVKRSDVIPEVPKTRSASTAWAEREEGSSWIDKL